MKKKYICQVFEIPNLKHDCEVYDALFNKIQQVELELSNSIVTWGYSEILKRDKILGQKNRYTVLFRAEYINNTID